MKPKGEQFTQLDMFGPQRDWDVVRERRVAQERAADEAAARDPQAQAKSDEEALFGPEKPFSRVDQTSSGSYVQQASLPNAMPVTQTARPSSKTERLQQERRYEWVPTWELSTEQSGVGVNKMSNMARKGIDYSGREEGTPRESLARQFPAQAQKTDQGYVLSDGNHRTTVERHQGALFHRLVVKYPEQPHPEPDGGFTAFGEGRYDP